MTSAGIQPFFRKYNINIGYYDGFIVYPSKVTERIIALKLHKNHFCSIWKSQDISFNQAAKDLKNNFEVFDNVISDKHVKSFIKYEYKPKKVQPQLINMIVYDLKTFNTDKAVLYANCIYRSSKISCKCNRDITQTEYEKCRKDCIVFKGTDSNNEMLDYVLQFKGAGKKPNKKIVNYTSCKLALNGSGFDNYVVLKYLPQWRTVVTLIKNGSGFVSLKIYNGYVDENKKFPQYDHLKCGRVHIYISMKNIVVSYKLQRSLLKQELEADEIYEDNWEEKENEWLPYLENDVLSTAFSYARYAKGMEKLTGFGIKNSLALLSLANKYFNSSRDENDESNNTYSDPFLRNCLEQSIKGGHCSGLNQ